MPAVMKLPGLRTSLPLVLIALGAIAATQSCISLPADPAATTPDAGGDTGGWKPPSDAGADSDAAGDGGLDAGFDAGGGEAGPAVSASATSLDFKLVNCGGAANPIGVTLTNNTANSFAYAAAVSDGGPFAVRNPTAGTLPGSGTSVLLVDVSLPPSIAPGVVSSALTVTVGSGDAAVALPPITLTAQLAGAVLGAPDAIDSIVHIVPTSADASVTRAIAITNSGTLPATISPSLTPEGSAFSFAFDGGGDASYIVSPDASFSLLVTFDPTGQAGTAFAVLDLGSSGSICSDLPTIGLAGEQVGWVYDAGWDAGTDAARDASNSDGGTVDATVDAGLADAASDASLVNDASVDATIGKLVDGG